MTRRPYVRTSCRVTCCPGGSRHDQMARFRLRQCAARNSRGMGTDADNITDLYNRHASAWVRARSRNAQFDERGWLETFCGRIGASGSVLDMGCGAGEPIATYFVKHGYSVTGVDSSKAMIDLFRERLPDQEAF